MIYTIGDMHEVALASLAVNGGGKDPAKKCRQAASFCRGRQNNTDRRRTVQAKRGEPNAGALKRLAETRFLSGLLSCRQRS